MSVSNVLSNRYDHLRECALNIVSNRKRPSSNPTDDSHDLLSYTAEHFLSSDKYCSLNDTETEAMMVTFMKNQWNWSNASSSKSFKRIHRLESNDSEKDDYRREIDRLSLSYDDTTKDSPNYEILDIIDRVKMDNSLTIFIDTIGIKDTPIWILDTIADLTNEGYSDDQIYQVLSAKNARKQMSPSERVLFDLYFEQDLSIRDIGKLFGIPRSTVKKMLDSIKEKCRNEHSK